MTKHLRTERTGWRDGNISERHRLWGFNCPAIDLDFILVEYDSNEPSALIEYKNERAAPFDSESSGYKTIANLADKAGLPAFYVRYTSDLRAYDLFAMNGKAKAVLKGRSEKKGLTEIRYVKFLYYLRGRDVPSHILGNLTKYQ
jgi:hypothetical protein